MIKKKLHIKNYKSKPPKALFDTGKNGVNIHVCLSNFVTHQLYKHVYNDKRRNRNKYEIVVLLNKNSKRENSQG